MPPTTAMTTIAIATIVQVLKTSLVEGGGVGVGVGEAVGVTIGVVVGVSVGVAVGEGVGVGVGVGVGLGIKTATVMFLAPSSVALYSIEVTGEWLVASS